MRLAIVTEDLNQYGGAERVVKALHETFPTAPIYTSLYEPKALPNEFRTYDIRTSFLQRIPLNHRLHRALLLLYPMAYESFDLSEFDVVVSVSSRFANGVVTPPSTLHINYCLTPMRFAWSYGEYVERERMGKAIRTVLPFAIHYLRMWDFAASQRVDRFVGISSVVRERIQKYYRRDADVLFPPVDAEDIPLGSASDGSFLVVSRLVPYKRIDLAVAACSKLGTPLTVIGAGRDQSRLERAAGPTVRFAGRLSDAETRAAMGRAGALLFPGYEDFGITPVEAMAAGTPVIAYRAGGALDTVVPGETGEMFAPQTIDALADQIAHFNPARYDPDRIRAHALKFDVQLFRDQMAAYVEKAWSHSQTGAFAPHDVASV
jgi:glycosyltransferase involved in cell wall biosynthesis